MDNRFAEIVSLIQSARAVNKELINLYWNVGIFSATIVHTSGWG